MKNKIINNLILLIKNNNREYNSTDLEKIRYGLEGVYLTFEKTIILMTVCFFIGILKEFVILTILFSGIRIFAFGLHAPNSFICLMLSLIIFVFSTYLSTVIIINMPIKITILIVMLFLILRYAPSDTHKRPLINKKRRKKYKFLSLLIALLYSVLSIIMKKHFISNCLLFALIIETLLILPISYKALNLPYNNYKKYYKE